MNNIFFELKHYLQDKFIDNYGKKIHTNYFYNPCRIRTISLHIWLGKLIGNWAAKLWRAFDALFSMSFWTLSDFWFTSCTLLECNAASRRACIRIISGNIDFRFLSWLENFISTLETFSSLVGISSSRSADRNAESRCFWLISSFMWAHMIISFVHCSAIGSTALCSSIICKSWSRAALIVISRLAEGFSQTNGASRLFNKCKTLLNCFLVQKF